jgi:putative nucleotidyltransferase with HDIG domain
MQPKAAAALPDQTGINPASRQPIRVPIRVKITLPFLLVALALALGASYVITQLVFDSLDERFTNQLIESGKLATSSMVKVEDHLLETMRLLANGEGIPAAVATGDAETLRSLAFGITVNQGAEAVEFIDDQGNLLLAMRHRPGGKLEDYEFLKGGGNVYLQWEFVQKVFAHQEDAKGDKYAGLVQADGGQTFTIAGPLYRPEGQFAGIVLVSRSLSSLAQDLRAGANAQVSFYDSSGSPLASTLPEQSPLEARLASDLLDHQSEQSVSRSLESTRELAVMSLPYTEILGAWEARQGEDLGLIGVAVLKSYFVKASQSTRLQISALVGFALLLVIFMGMYIANHITRPLLGLVRASAQVSQGDLSVQVQPTSNDEVAFLTETFNQMIGNLNLFQQELLNAYDSTLEGWSRALELRDKETEGHTQRVATMTMEIAKKLGIIDPGELTNLRRGALLHDIGKMGIPDAILLKPGPLTPEERKVMEQHTTYAYELLSPIEYLRPVLDIPYCHHEKWDGSGYPRGLKGEEIPLSARIFALVDVWDALTNDRPYRKAMPPEQAEQIISEGSGSHFDPQIVEVFRTLL